MAGAGILLLGKSSLGSPWKEGRKWAAGGIQLAVDEPGLAPLGQHLPWGAFSDYHGLGQELLCAQAAWASPLTALTTVGQDTWSRAAWQGGHGATPTPRWPLRKWGS